jgi:alpha-L-rhamnosidase
VVASTSGGVNNAGALVGQAQGAATLTWDGTGAAPSILLDYGKEVGSVPHFSISAVVPPLGALTVTMRAAYSEARKFMTATGDTSEFPVRRYEDFQLAAPGEVTSQTLQGGFRFQLITLTSAGSVSISAVGARVEFENAAPSDYQGWFASSDALLNRIWYSGAYTVQTDMAPPGTQYGNSTPWILDGAKRDRAVWSGDVFVQGPTTYMSLGSKGSPYLRGALNSIGLYQQPDGATPGAVGLFGPSGVYYSLSYSMYYALGLVDYYRYTGDVNFAQNQYATFRRQMLYDSNQVDPQSGLLVAGSGPGQGSPVFGQGDDWDVYDGAKTGAVAAFNMIYYRALTDAAWFARRLGSSADADMWAAQAEALRPKINAAFFDSSRGVYKLAAADIGAHPATAVAQDANGQAIAFGVADPGSNDRILRFLRDRLWVADGALPFSRDAGYSTNLSPFSTGYELAGRFAASDTRGALVLMHRTWDKMVTPASPYYAGTFWEKMLENGTVEDGAAATSKAGFVSLAHGWATAPTADLSRYVLGVQPIEPGFVRWSVRPQPGGLKWAEGQVPTPTGAIGVKWAQDAARHAFALRVTAPSGTAGEIGVPATRRSVVRVNGRQAWDGKRARHYRAHRAGGYVYLEGVPAGTYRITSVTRR